MLERDAARELGVFQVLDGGEMLVDQRGVGKRPQVLGGLQFGRVRRQKEQVHVVRHPQLDAGVPAGAIEDQHDLLAGAGADLARELGELDFEERNAHRGGQVKDGATRGGMDETHQVAPFEPVLDGRGGPLADWRPDARQQRLQPDPMFVGGPHFDLSVGKRRGHRLHERS